MTDRPGPRPRRDEPVVSGPQERLAARIATSRKARRQRALLVLSGTMSALVLLVAGSAWALTGYVNDAVRRVDAGTAGAPASGPLNILVAGVDQRSGLTAHEQYVLHVGHDVSYNSDTMMLVHVSASRSSVTVVSLPRDSWVTIPGHGMNKINAAYGLGGPKLMVQTVEQATGLAVNDYVQVNFLAFVKVIDALGGVNICLPYAVDDSYSGLKLSAGRHHVNGITALEYARDRHSFAASDLQRIKDQQQLVSSALSEAISAGTLANPLRLSSFLRAALGAVKVDSNFNASALADEMRGISARDVTFVTVPLANLDYQAPSGESAVLWDSQAAGQLFADLANDRSPGVTKAPASHVAPGGRGSGSSGSGSGSAAGAGSSGAGSPGSGSFGSGSSGSGSSAAGGVAADSASHDACR
jgi:LCP family protein required for cell wall assembly